MWSRRLTPDKHAVHGEKRATIIATSTTVPSYVVSRDDVKAHLQRVFLLDGSRLDGTMAIVDNSHVKQRHTIFPLEYTIDPRPLTQTNLEYQEHAIRLGHKAASKCLDGALMSPDDI